MLKNFAKRCIAMLLTAVMIFSLIPVLPMTHMHVHATTVNVLDGNVSVTDTANNCSVSGGTVTATAKGSLFSKATNTITITNETDTRAELKFTYSASSANSFTIGGTAASTSGTHTILLDAGGSVTLVLTSNSGFSGTTATLTLSEFSLTAVADSSNVTFAYDNTLGSITVGGAAMANGGTQENVSATTGVALVATPASGASFLGWINAADGSILSTAASYTLKPAGEMTVRAVFAKNGGTPWFMIGAAAQQTQSSGLLGMTKNTYYTVPNGVYLFDDLNAAAAKAAATANKCIVLMNDGTLSAGTYTIPSGVTLLIPFDASNTLYTTYAASIAPNTNNVFTDPTAYRTLTMASGANLIVNGVVSLSAKHYYAQGSKYRGGSPAESVSFVRMEGDSSITVNNGGVLYTYGFITGSGKVTAKSGAKVYENFQIMDFRGGTQSTDMQNGVFPLNQYYVQNIEVPLTLEAGATEYAFTTIYMSNADFSSSVGFIGSSGAMFNLTSGSVTKQYDGSTDRLLVEINGQMSVAGITMEIGTSSLDSADYELPVNSNITLTVKSGSTITLAQDIALLPGSQILVNEGAFCTVAENTNVYIYDADEWGGYAAPSNQKLIPVGYAPGRTYNRTAADLVDAMIQVDGTIDGSKGNVYTTAGGANIYSNGTGIAILKPGTQTVTHQLIQNTGYVEIPLTPAKLKNGNGTYLESSKDQSGNTYVYEDGFWRCQENHSWDEGVVTTQPTCAAAGVKTYTCTTCGKTRTEAIATTGHTDANKDHVCDNGCDVYQGTHEDTNQDHQCEYGCSETIGVHEDTNQDHVCDYGCSESIGTCEDADKDHACDHGCGKTFGTCEDADKDHACDYGCDKTFGEHADADKDHTCDYGCSESMGTCEDANKDHACDYGCDKIFGTCEDANKDHACDYGCDKIFGICEDTDKDHACDYGCDKVFGDHVDTDKDHACDYGCSETIGTCEDADKDHACDYGCDKTFGEHADADKDHACDYGCSEAIGTCEDADKDHACDYGCDKTFGDHVDTDKDHACDYGCDQTFGDHVDADKDHNCDYGCDQTFGDHVDTDKDHACDYGCNETFGDHEDTNKDHACDYGCSEAIGTCEDADRDHACDYGCDKTFGDHEDTDKDHICDYGCNQAFGTCDDADKDHACDYGCDKIFGICEDADKDHACDYGCDKTFGTCEDTDKDHACDYGCDQTFGEHTDVNKDHACDYGCAEKIGDCEDADLNHECDYGCGKAFGKHEDTDKDHVCDYGCSEPIGTCEDADKDHACDYGCGKAFGKHEDTDKDHACDYGCSEPIGACEDADRDHDCDYGCDKIFGKHEDTDKDHKCDYGCSEAIGTCEDADKDHNCDYGCDKTFGDHVDANQDHACDYGCTEAIGTCEDADKDHGCDYGCDKVFDECADQVGDGDHVCDYGCGAVLTQCEDADTDHVCDECTKNVGVHGDTDKNHVCDYGCSESIGEHSDKSGDGNHVCDYGCGATLTECVDTDKDHTCEECGAGLGAHIDTDKDHACDYGCSAQIGTHEDTNFDHICEYGCSVAIGDHEDTNQDHACDYGCAEIIGEHIDSENDGDHVCDHGCGATLSQCADTNKDHACDECDAEMGEHADAANDGDHVCDYGCGQTLTDCFDSEFDQDHKCDECDTDGITDHEWVDATCTTAKTCSVCHETDGDALGHSMTKTQAQEATCTTDGTNEYYTCSACNKVFKDAQGTTETTAEAEFLPMLGHDGGEGEVTTQPTCLVDGVRTFTCSRCDHTWEEAVAATGHQIVYDAQQDPTCTQPGEAAGSHCAKCDYVTGNTVIPALGHDWDTEGYIKEGNEPTCTETGLRTFTCQRDDCGETEDREEAALGHSMHKTDAKDETCTRGGNNAYYTCSVCKNVYKDEAGESETTVEDETIPATGVHIDQAGDADHLCDYGCGETASSCEDGDKDHSCDECNENMGTHEDADMDHICDYGCAEKIGTHEDTNQDHVCDYGCDETFGTHEDSNKDHVCDYGCTETIGEHTDANKDHKCDYGCAETIGEHADAADDGDHLCDYGCNAKLSSCEDDNKDHVCDECDAQVGTHSDANRDHICDYGCAESIGEHADAANDGNHVCDYGCGATLSECEDADKDHDCDECGTGMGVHQDTNKDHICDYGCAESIGEHADAANDGNHVCDYGCGTTMSDCADADTDHDCDECDAVMGEHVDADLDHKCDYGCSEAIGTCEDTDKDHDCDYGCDKTFGIHEDTNKDHICDYGCSETIGTCEDADKDHDCDYGCDKTFGVHEDTDLDHKCEYGCSVTIGSCADKDLDHACDYGCDKIFGTHKDIDKDHACDYGCSETIGTCEDADKDHACDYGCDKFFGTHEDTDKDHVCDYGCSEAIGTCEDADKDHDCDYGCDKLFGTHEDTDKDHVCDYGCSELFGTHEDTDKDHVCDYGCSEAIGTCEDADKDHDCDYGCDKTFGECIDQAGDGDHVCDYGCGKALSECTDADKNHACDECGAEMGKHADSANDGDHVCDYGCGGVLTECEDSDKDHKCDECDAIMGQHADANKDHICDYGCSEPIGVHADSANDGDHVCDYGCGEKLSNCADADKDHKCGECDAAMGEHADSANDGDHICDYGCGATLTECEDSDKNHACDECGAEMGEHADCANDGDHVCDYGCGGVLTECEDSDKDHKCDECDATMGQHVDANKDHICDYGCSESIGVHADSANDGDHVCDYGCGVKLSDCADSNTDKDHKCDECGMDGITDHEWKDATCTAAKTCAVCGQTEGTALDHDMAPATCSAPATCKRENCGYTEGKPLPHTPVKDEGYPAFCEDTGRTDGSHCSVCGTVLVQQEIIPALGHDIQYHEAKKPTYSNVGWEAYEDCTRCAYTTYVEIPALEAPVIDTYESFLTNLALLEEIAYAYVQQNPGKDPAALVIKYIRTGVDRYNSGSWGIMAGYEDAGFAKFVSEMEDMINSSAEDESMMICVTSMKNIENFTIPNGNYVDFGHMFGTMDITYHNNYSVNHADVAGWAGDLVDLLSTADRHGVSGTMDEMVTDISENYLNKSLGESDIFSLTDMYGDLDGFYIMQKLQGLTYETGTLTEIIENYFTYNLTDEYRAEFFLRNRLNGVSTRGDIRDAVYNAYTGNKVVFTLEGTREFTSDQLDDLKKACCYSFADYLCKLAGDYVEVTDNPYYSVFSSETSTLAPGITQKIEMATSADGKQMVYYLATADLNRDDVHIFANYNNNDPAAGWAMQRVLDQANAAQNKYGDPNSQYYVPNYNVIVGINGAGFNMSTGEPSGLLVMNGVVYQDINASGFFGILKDGTAVIGTKEEYLNIYKDQVAEGIAGFGSTLVENGKICINRTETYYTDRASRTAVGITKTGKVVFMVLDGRQEPWSCGGSMQEIAQIMLEAGCVHAINLDGGGSTTFVAKREGADALSVVNKPSDGVERSVSTSLIMVSTAPSSTAFDHAILESKTDYMTVGSSIQITATGVSATGNAAQIPEGATWAVSDERWGTISEDGVFTALRNGDVDVYLMLDGQIIGQKTIHVVIPNQVYFTKSNMNTVYGQSVELPVKALYNGKEVTIRPADLVFTMNNETAGMIEGFSFTGNEAAGIKIVTITAALANETTVSASIIVNLYKQGENSFDFDQAVGGNRELAWDRQVSNSTTDDAITYVVVDQNKDMVTSYVFAIDMTQIPIPKQLEDLIYMLPGSDMEGASAWNFLLQLAERVSVLSTVQPVIRFDPNFDVDYSELKLVNEYFTLSALKFDEATNSLTLTLNWIDQTQPIDPTMANPLCLVSGIKLTPKDDAQWNDKAQLTVVNSGEISYEIYLRASGLYSFAQKPENQATYGLYPYINPNDSSDKGGYFGSVYNTFQDTYTLVNALKNGWVNEDGGFAYYVDGVRHTGIRMVDGLYYDFGESGINIGKTPYSGLFEENGKTYYAKNGLLVNGWQAIGNDWYLFSWSDYHGIDGTYQITIEGVEVTYEMDNGRVAKGYWHEDEVGLQYFYGPYRYHKGWKEIDGERYFFENYYAHTGIHPVRESHAVTLLWYEFAEDGRLIGELADGFYWYEGELYYIVNIVAVNNGLNLIDGDYYYFNANGTAVRGKTMWVSKTNGLVEAGTYRFAADGKAIMTTELVDENGTLYYYCNGKRTASAGVIEWNGNYYYIGSGAIAITNRTAWVEKTNGYVEVGTYRFAADGKMILTTEVVNENGTYYYYCNGRRTPNAGLILFEGEYYYIDGSAKAAVSKTIWVSRTNGLKPEGSYSFDAEGKMIRHNGVVEGYYYVDGVRTAAGLVEFEGSYYYAGSNGKVVTSQSMWVSNTNGLVPVGTYRFDAEGKMLMTTGVVNEDGTLYYYLNGKRTNAGLVEYEGAYYYFANNGTAFTNGTTWVSKTNGLVTAGTYRFAEDGKMIMTTDVVNENGTYYYYYNGRRTANAGLVFVNDEYYYIDGAAKAVTNTTMYVSKTNGLIPAGTYTFDAEGKLYLHHQILHGYYYYEGEKHAAGVVEINGSYYYAGAGGLIFTSRTFWAGTTNGLIEVGTYRAAADGKLIMTTELVDENGTLYYYQNGKRTANAGVLQIGGSYYYIGSGAIAITGRTAWVSKTNGYVEAGTYRFAEDGKMIMTTEIVNEDGTLYYYFNGRRTANAGLILFDGSYYYIDGYAKAVVGRIVWVSRTNGYMPEGYYTFDENGKMILPSGIINGYYYVDGVKTEAGLILVDGFYYYAGLGGEIYTNSAFWINKTNGLLPAGTYRADADGKLIMTTELVNENGTLYYYKDGKRTANAGLLEINGSYYYIASEAIAIAGKTAWVSKTNGLVTAGTYRFAADGKMIMTTEVANEDGILYYYLDGRRTANAGLILFDGSYYYIDGSAKAVVGRTVWVSKTNGYVPEGNYTFDENGKMIMPDGIMDGYYYVNGVKTAAGLIEIDGFYYYAGSGGKIYTSRSFWAGATNGLLPAGTYRVDAEGKFIMTTELVNEDGTLYYYKDGKRTANAGVLEIDGSYYYVGPGAIAIANGTAWVSKTNGYVEAGTYRFDAEGKMILTTELVDEEGLLYYYLEGRRASNAGLILYDGAYYYIGADATAVTNDTIWVSKTNGLLPEGSYTFGEDGKMIP